MTLLSCRGITSKYAPKGEFLKRRAVSLRRSGYKPTEIAQMLQAHYNTIFVWFRPDRGERRNMERMMDRAEKAAALLEAPSALPTLPYVPGIIVTGRYRMRAP